MVNYELYYLWMSQAFGYGSIFPKKLIEIYGDPKSFYEDKDKYQRCEFLNNTHKRRIENTSLDNMENLREKCIRRKNKIIYYDDPFYPKRLKNIDNPPMVLYYCGDIKCLSEKRCVGIVGSRNTTSYVADITERLAYVLASKGIIIVSGCAAGIDSCAHSGANKTGRTAAIIGTPLDHDYPKGIYKLKREIIDKKGVVISEYPPDESVNRRRFPVRNRLIAGVSDVVVVTQAGEKSGSKITANFAVEYGKELFCVPPADIESPVYSGVNSFLRDGAKPLLSAQDVLDYFLIDSPPNNGLDEIKTRVSQLSSEAKMIYNALDLALSENELVDKLGIGVDVVLRGITELEIEGLVKHVGNTIKRNKPLL